MNYYQINVADGKVIINGLFVLGFCRKFSRKEKKKPLNIIRESAIETWVNKSSAMAKSLENAVHDSVETTLGMLHDVKTAVSVIFRNAESLIYEESGETIDEKIENAPHAKKKLFKSVSLLEERLKMMSLVSNPESASHGGKHPLPIYKVFDKNLKIFHAIANKKNIRLNLIGHSFSSPRLYASFSTIPLVLIDNAIKYSQPNQDITVSINDTNGGVSVQVESYSLRINKNDSEKIFKKNFRATGAKKVAVEGSGLGLYLADIVAYANGFDISHTETGNSHMIDGLPYINNIFSFYVPNA
jgi:K+-sensing histidine kinase KdpD